MCDVHQFGGEFIDRCAHVEQWAETAIDASKEKVPHLFGQKMNAVLELAKNQPKIFAKPSRVEALLEKFAPFVALRAALAHSTVDIAGTADSSVYVFALPCTAASPIIAKRFWLRHAELKPLLADLKRLSKEICDQKIQQATTPPDQ